MPQAHVAGSGIAIPYLVSMEQFLNIDERMRRAHGQSEKIIQRLRSFSEGTRIHTCHYLLHPHWLAGLETSGELPAGALTKVFLHPIIFCPPTNERMKVFDATRIKLGIATAKDGQSQRPSGWFEGLGFHGGF